MRRSRSFRISAVPARARAYLFERRARTVLTASATDNNVFRRVYAGPRLKTLVGLSIPFLSAFLPGKSNSTGTRSIPRRPDARGGIHFQSVRKSESRKVRAASRVSSVSVVRDCFELSTKPFRYVPRRRRYRRPASRTAPDRPAEVRLIPSRLRRTRFIYATAACDAVRHAPPMIAAAGNTDNAAVVASVSLSQYSYAPTRCLYRGLPLCR